MPNLYAVRAGETQFVAGCYDAMSGLLAEKAGQGGDVIRLCGIRQPSGFPGCRALYDERKSCCGAQYHGSCLGSADS